MCLGAPPISFCLTHTQNTYFLSFSYKNIVEITMVSTGMYTSTALCETKQSLLHLGHFLMQIGLSVVGVMGADHSRKAFNKTKPSCQMKVCLGTPPSSFYLPYIKIFPFFLPTCLTLGPCKVSRKAASLATCQRNRAPG